MIVNTPFHLHTLLPFTLQQPAGPGVAMALVPAMHSGDSRVFLWSRSNISTPLHVFTGHSEPVLEVQWRQYRGGMSKQRRRFFGYFLFSFAVVFFCLFVLFCLLFLVWRGGYAYK